MSVSTTSTDARLLRAHPPGREALVDEPAAAQVLRVVEVDHHPGRSGVGPDAAGVRVDLRLALHRLEVVVAGDAPDAGRLVPVDRVVGPEPGELALRVAAPEVAAGDRNVEVVDHAEILTPPGPGEHTRGGDQILFGVVQSALGARDAKIWDGLLAARMASVSASTARQDRLRLARQVQAALPLVQRVVDLRSRARGRPGVSSSTTRRRSVGSGERRSQTGRFQPVEGERHAAGGAPEQRRRSRSARCARRVSGGSPRARGSRRG